MQDEAPSGSSNWKLSHVIILCAVCAMVGVTVGYLVRGSESQSAQPPVVQQASAPSMPPSPGQMPSLEDMRHMADKQAEPLLAQLKADPKNPKLLNQVGLVYKTAHNFKEAANYFSQSLQYDPKNLAIRADYATCLYFSGDVDGALSALNKSLTYDPQHAGTLMNIGIIKLKGKNDPTGAVDAWQKILKYHPDFPQKEMLQHMIDQAKQTGATDSQKS